MFKLGMSGVVSLLLVALLAIPASAEANGDWLMYQFEELEVDEQTEYLEYVLGTTDYLTPEMLAVYREHLMDIMYVEVINYVVQRGDTLTAIAARHDVSIDTICHSNNISNPNRINTGQELTFPSVSGLLYRVKTEDETLLEIAELYQVHVMDIIYANRLEVFTLKPEQVLVLPGASMPSSTRLTSSASRSRMPKIPVPAMIWPIQGRISSLFGARNGTHLGLDIVNSTGTPIKAALAGEVIFSGWRSGYGRMVRLDHGNGIETVYAHASSLLVSEGDFVEQGSTIALVGSTGNSTGPHLHFEVRVKGVPYNPLKFLPR